MRTRKQPRRGEVRALESAPDTRIDASGTREAGRLLESDWDMRTSKVPALGGRTANLSESGDPTSSGPVRRLVISGCTSTDTGRERMPLTSAA